MTRIIELKGLQFANKSQALIALDYYVEKNVDWTDAFMAAQLIAKGIKEIYTFDKHFKKFAELTKIEP
ncbi:MAG: PilT protein domain protein [Firmicutes bacterium]|nr:PilT protein domain protein [Bacillota bacterium]